MANWQMEIGKMISYIFFPIGVFYCTNRIVNMDEWLVDQREKCLPVDHKKHTEFLEFIEEFNRNRRLKQLEELEQQYKGNKTKQFANV